MAAPPHEGSTSAPAGGRDALRAEVHAWLDENWDPGLSVDDWWRLVAKAGWTAPHLPPEQGGRGLPRNAATTVRSEFVRHGALRPPGGLGLLMAAPTILTHGSADQIARHVPPILDGQTNWCQLFSEPGAGSDLAGLTTRAERDGDRWVINGQKVWSSMARDCDHGMLLARTDFSARKHAGISWFAFSLDQPGVTVRPLREMTGESVFNEVFFDDAVCDDADLVGGEGNGWKLAQTTLFFERSGIGAGGSHAGFPPPGPKGGFLGRNAGEAAQEPAPDGNLIVKLPELIDLAAAQGRTADPHVRQDLARLHTHTVLGMWNAQRAKAEAARGGGKGIANLGKILQTRITKDAANLAIHILGADGMLAEPDGVEGGRFATSMVFSPASGIYGGADEIQRNVIAEQGLGLPRDNVPGREGPYGEFLRTLRPRD
ncbi:MAG TPA: acyl-CoA dehydrogenase family protein [Acidimicrobiales bacterium]|jgi:alkylation response protein AidB-like acyl-CoA dehydrogenase|nr:acyl-CoA dehydrogenase family protein [Acidimicrobiales bacterium]